MVNMSRPFFVISIIIVNALTSSVIGQYQLAVIYASLLWLHDNDVVLC